MLVAAVFGCNTWFIPVTVMLMALAYRRAETGRPAEFDSAADFRFRCVCVSGSRDHKKRAAEGREGVEVGARDERGVVRGSQEEELGDDGVRCPRCQRCYRSGRSHKCQKKMCKRPTAEERALFSFDCSVCMRKFKTVNDKNRHSCTTTRRRK